MKYYCFRTLPGAKGNYVPKGFPIGFEMVEKNAKTQTHTHTHTHTHFRIYISRDFRNSFCSDKLSETFQVQYKNIISDITKRSETRHL